MATRTRTLRHRYDGAYRLDANWLKHFAATVEDLGLPPVTVSARLANDRRAGELTIDELLALRNGKGELIERISISSSRYDDTPLLVSAQFSPTDYSIDIDGNERDAVYADHRLRALLQDLPVWYGWIATTKLSLVLSLIVMVIGAINIITIPLVVFALYRGLISKADGQLALSIMAPAGVVIMLLAFAPQVLVRLFPRCEFLIGEGVARSEARAAIRQQLLWVFIIGVAVTLVGGLVTKWLGVG